MKATTKAEIKAKAGVATEMGALGDMWAALKRVEFTARPRIMRALAQLAGISHNELMPR